MTSILEYGVVSTEHKYRTISAQDGNVRVDLVILGKTYHRPFLEVAPSYVSETYMVSAYKAGCGATTEDFTLLPLELLAKAIPPCKRCFR